MNKQINLRVKFCFCSYMSENVKRTLIVEMVRNGRITVLTCIYIVFGLFVCVCVCVCVCGLKNIHFCNMNCILGDWYSKEIYQE